MRHRHVLSALVQNQPGVLAHISGMLASRGFNIDSLAVGETEQHDRSRMTFVVHGDDNVLDQVRKQLDKIVTVVRVEDISSENFVERDLMLIKVTCSSEKRPEVFQLVESFRGISYLSTGVTVDRVAEDDIVVPTVHFTKPNGELTSISLDENTKIVRV